MRSLRMLQKSQRWTCRNRQNIRAFRVQSLAKLDLGVDMQPMVSSQGSNELLSTMADRLIQRRVFHVLVQRISFLGSG